MKRYTIAQIADHVTHSGGHYFDRDSMRFFGQRRKDFTVYHYADRIFTIAPSGDSWHGLFWSIAEYDPTTGSMDKHIRAALDAQVTK
jgi:hypothetical protein